MTSMGKARGAGRIAVVVNPRSANGRTGKRWPAMGSSLREAVGAYTLLLTESPRHATELVRQALREGHDRIISVGGDGGPGSIRVHAPAGLRRAVPTPVTG